jgi:hypothetical protein
MKSRQVLQIMLQLGKSLRESGEPAQACDIGHEAIEIARLHKMDDDLVWVGGTLVYLVSALGALLVLLFSAGVEGDVAML